MQNIRIVKKPGYAVDSVDRALQLILLLQENSWLRIADAARTLDVAPSTAHRLMSTLVYRGFALQDDQRRYCAGPALRSGTAAGPDRALIAAARPHLEALALDIQETVNLVERVGTTARYLFSAEGPQLLRVGNRAGTVLPAHLSSAGKAILSTLADSAVGHLYTRQPQPGTSGAVRLPELLSELQEVRRLGYAVNMGGTEAGLAAVGVPVSASQRHQASLGISVSAPLDRAERIRETPTLKTLMAAGRDLARSLDTAGLAPGTS